MTDTRGCESRPNVCFFYNRGPSLRNHQVLSAANCK